MQPPPRGCVLKQQQEDANKALTIAAASARLCVETSDLLSTSTPLYAAASARLCVETETKSPDIGAWQPPPRGCVLKRILYNQ